MWRCVAHSDNPRPSESGLGGWRLCGGKGDSVRAHNNTPTEGRGAEEMMRTGQPVSATTTDADHEQGAAGHGGAGGERDDSGPAAQERCDSGGADQSIVLGGDRS